MTNLSYRIPEGAYATLKPTFSPSAPEAIRVLSYNIQNAIATHRYRHYVTGGWKHVLPHRQRHANLERIGEWVAPYDLIGLQEVDAGSFRTGFMNQVEHLAYKADFPYWYFQTNRNMGRLAQQSNGLLARYRPAELREHRLPGIVPGRGALQIRFGTGREALNVIQVHMALGRRARLRQMAFLADLVNAHRHVIVMGDLNCRSESRELARLSERTNLSEPIHGLHTFPSWRPNRNIDHILISSTLEVRRARVLDCALSDHLPIAMDLILPESVRLPA